MSTVFIMVYNDLHNLALAYCNLFFQLTGFPKHPVCTCFYAFVSLSTLKLVRSHLPFKSWSKHHVCNLEFIVPSLGFPLSSV